jgi:leader peptidase (prepilin peptidase)/N-methyltransferase
MTTLFHELAGSGTGGVVACAFIGLTCAAFLYFGARLALADAREHLLPDRFTLPLAATVLVLASTASMLVQDWAMLGRVWACAGLATALFLAVHLASPATMGFGDVKLVPALGGITGLLSWGHPLLALVLAVLVAGLHAIVVMIWTRNAKAHIAFGPALLFGTAAALCV